MSNDLCSVGYTWRAYPAAFAFSEAKRHGYRCVELRDYQGCDWGSPSAFADLATRARAAGLEPWALFQVIDLPAPADADRALAGCARVIDLMREHRIRVWHTRLHVPGIGDSRAAGAEHYASGGAFLARVGALAAAAGVLIAVESHMGTIHDTAATQARLLDRCDSPAVTAGLDFANLVISEAAVDLAAVIRRFAGRIGYVHLKNVVRRGDGWDWNIPLRAGDIDYRRLLPVLAAAYRGPIGIEYCGPGDPAWISEDDARYARAILAAGGASASAG